MKAEDIAWVTIGVCMMLNALKDIVFILLNARAEKTEGKK